MSVNREKVCILDGSNFVFRASILPYLNYQGEATEILYGFCKMLLNLQRNFRFSEYFVCWDGGVSNRRRQLLASYKKKIDYEAEQEKLNRLADIVDNLRKIGDEEFFKQKNEELKKQQIRWNNLLEEKKKKERIRKQIADCKLLASLLGLNNVCFDGIEADDLMCVLCHLLKEKKKIIVSSDKDVYQLIDKNTEVYNPITDESLREDNFYHVTGIEKEKFILYRCLVGDNSDNIKGIMGIGEKRAMHIIKNYSFDDLHAGRYKLEDIKIVEKVLKEKE